MAVLGGLAAILEPAAVLNAVAPVRGLRIETGIAYGDGGRRVLDLYAPASPDAQAPVVIFFYGGSWQRGSRSSYKFLAADLAARGFIVVVPDYTVFPDGKFPDFLQDGAQVVAWVTQDRSRPYRSGPDRSRPDRSWIGGSTGPLVLMGHSAGAHIAAMLAFDTRWLGAVGLDPRRDIGALVGLAGPYDFLPIQDPTIRIIFASDAPQQTQPLTHVAGGEAPVFLGIAPSDTTVRPGNSQRLASRLESVGTPVVLRAYPHTNHLTIVGAFSPLLRWLAPVADDVERFLRTTPTRAR